MSKILHTTKRGSIIRTGPYNKFEQGLFNKAPQAVLYGRRQPKDPEPEQPEQEEPSQPEDPAWVSQPTLDLRRLRGEGTIMKSESW